MSRILFSIILLMMLAASVISADFQATLATVAAYNYGDSRESLTVLSELLRQSASDKIKTAEYESLMLKTVAAPKTTFAAKQYLCKELSIMGSEQAAPIIGKMLYSEATADIARYALERIPGDKVDETLIKAAQKTKGLVKVGIINTIGERRMTSATSLLSKALDGGDVQIAGAAASALGKIGTVETEQILAAALKTAPPSSRPTVVVAYLQNADHFLTTGAKAEAKRMFEQLFAPSEAPATRTAALTGLVQTVENPTTLIVDVLQHENPTLQAAAISVITSSARPIDVTPIAALLPDLPSRAQLQLITALKVKGDSIVRPNILAATQSNDNEIAVAAISALAAVGNADDVLLLAQIAASNDEEKRQAAKESLARLNAPGVDEKILSTLDTAESLIQAQLVEAVGARNIKNATAELLQKAKSENRRVSVAALKALSDTATPPDLPRLIDVLIHAASDAERREGERTVVAVARRITETEKQGDDVIAALPNASDLTARSSLLMVLGRLGDEDALPILREALSSKDDGLKRAGILALSEWPNSIPIADLYQTAQNAESSHQVLALRGYITLIDRLDESTPANEKTAHYKAVLELAKNSAEKRAALSGLGKVHSGDAFDLAAAYLADSEVKSEAEIAVLENARWVRGELTPARVEVLKKIGESSDDERIKRAVNQMLPK